MQSQYMPTTECIPCCLLRSPGVPSAVPCCLTRLHGPFTCTFPYECGVRLCRGDLVVLLVSVASLGCTAHVPVHFPTGAARGCAAGEPGGAVCLCCSHQATRQLPVQFPQVRREAVQQGDLVVLPLVREHYHNITHQTLEAVRMAAADSEATHVLKVGIVSIFDH